MSTVHPVTRHVVHNIGHGVALVLGWARGHLVPITPTRRTAGQSTAEYALVLLGAATVALVFIAWAGKSSRIGSLFNAVLDTVIGKV